MSFLRVVPRNFHDESTLTTTASPATGFDVANTQNGIRARVWRSADDSSVTVKGTFADDINRNVNFFGMFLHRCHGGKLRLQVYSDAAWTTQTYDSGAVDINNVDVSDGADWGISLGGSNSDPMIEQAPYWDWFTAADCKSYQITFSDHASTYGRTDWQVSRFWLGRYVEAARQPAFGAALGFADLTDRNRSRGGSLRTNHGAAWRTMDLNLAAMNEDERAGWIDIFRYCGTGRELVVSLFPEEGTRKERDYIMNCKMAALNAIGRQSKILTTRLQLEEI